jgi:predicted ribosomally synthesized peptide with nif11-like leader
MRAAKVVYRWGLPRVEVTTVTSPRGSPLACYRFCNTATTSLRGRFVSQTDAGRFLDGIETDEAFAQQLEALKDTPDQVLDAERARGYDVDPDDVRDAFLERYSNDLTQEQFDAIAGGHFWGTSSHDQMAYGFAGGTLAMAAVVSAFI